MILYFYWIVYEIIIMIDKTIDCDILETFHFCHLYFQITSHFLKFTWNVLISGIQTDILLLLQIIWISEIIDWYYYFMCSQRSKISHFHNIIWELALKSIIKTTSEIIKIIKLISLVDIIVITKINDQFIILILYKRVSFDGYLKLTPFTCFRTVWLESSTDIIVCLNIKLSI